MSTFEMETIIFTNTFELIYLQSKNNLYIWSFDNETISGCFKTWFPCSFERRGPTHMCFQQMITKWLTIAECLKTKVESRMNIYITKSQILLVNITNCSWEWLNHIISINYALSYSHQKELINFCIQGTHASIHIQNSVKLLTTCCISNNPIDNCGSMHYDVVTKIVFKQI